MDDNVEPLNQVLLERLEPLVNTVERQLRDLGQGQVFLHSHVAELTSELALSQAEFDKIHDTFSRLPHYIAKLAAIRNTINTATIHSKKIKKRSELVISGREKQEARSQVSRAKERAYDKTIVASVRSNSTPSLLTPTTLSAPITGPALPSSTTQVPVTKERPRSPMLGRSSSVSAIATTTTTSSSSSPALRSSPLPTRSSNSPANSLSSSPAPSPQLSARLPSPLPAGQSMSSGPPSRGESPQPTLDLFPSADSSTINITEKQSSKKKQRELVDLFPQVSAEQDDPHAITSLSSTVEVVRLVRRKKKPFTGTGPAAAGATPSSSSRPASSSSTASIATSSKKKKPVVPT